jgi:ABC-2 type transport system permease protein
VVAVLARLQLTLMARGLRQSPARVVALVLGGVVGLVLVLGVVASFATISAEVAADVQTLTVMVLTGVLTAWIVLPLLLFGVDATLDPARFALLPLSVRQLRPGLLLAGLVGVPGVLTSIVALAPVLGWLGHEGVAALAALLIAPVFLLTCFLAARTLTSWFAAALASRRFQDFAAVVLGVFVVTIGLSTTVLSNSTSEDPERVASLVRQSADVLGWTPLGWAAAVPGDLAQQQWGAAGVRALLAVGLVVLLWELWGRALNRALTSISEVGVASVGGASALVDRLYPATPTGAVAARCLRYWRRDPRYSVSLVSMAVVPVMIGASTSLGSGGSVGLFLMPLIVAVMTGPGLVADLAYDHSALWTHVALGVPGRADRLGRVLAQATVIGPLILICLVAAVLINGRWDLVLAALAATITLTLCGYAVGVSIGSRYPGQAPPPGTNPFGTGGSGAGVLTMALFFGGALATMLIAAPLLVPLAIWGLDSVLIQALAVLVGLAWGGLVLRLAVAESGRRLEQSWPELLAQVSAEKR